MRKLRPKEIELLRAFPKEVDLGNGMKFTGWILPGQMPKAMHCTTIRNAYALGLVRVARSSLVEFYPLELTEAGKKALADHLTAPGREPETELIGPGPDDYGRGQEPNNGDPR